MQLLVIEGNPKLSDLIVNRLKKAYYDVDLCTGAAEAAELINGKKYDAMILDAQLEGVSGLDFLKTLREEGNEIPVLFLTERNRIDDCVNAMNYGANDFVIKPFLYPDLLARVRVLIRRTSDYPSNIFTVADLTVDCDTRTATRGERMIPLSAKEFAVLEYLIRNKGEILSRERISTHIWSYDYVGESNIVDVYIRYLRKKIDEPFYPRLIQTVRGVGYVLRAD
ncbi:MAG: response regulator transcription factor [Lachnospiraceae bacterium]|jgi:DNA-binding response OmpR family regulator|nr:response regulator transcription factor [Lachnospiraceae bacterium]